MLRKLVRKHQAVVIIDLNDSRALEEPFSITTVVCQMHSRYLSLTFQMTVEKPVKLRMHRAICHANTMAGGFLWGAFGGG